MTEFYPLTADQLSQIETFKKLSAKDQSAILEAIFNLEIIRSRGQTPSAEEILRQLSATGHLETGLACYVAQLKKIKWS